VARTLLDLDARLLESVRKLARAGTKREAVEIALRDFVRRHHARRLAEAAGTSSIRWRPADVRAMRGRR
jgi:Arc/MetJ family transcription regulator